MFDKKKQNITNIDHPFDYPTIKRIVLSSFKNISKQVKKYHHHEDDWSCCCPLIIDSDSNSSLPISEIQQIGIEGPLNNNNENKEVTLSSSPSSLLLLKLKIRNTTEYLKCLSLF